MKRLQLTAEQLARAKERYRPYGRGDRNIKTIARELGVSRDGLLRHIDPEWRRRRNASAAKYQRKKYVPRARKTSNDAKYAIARTKVTLAPVKGMDKSFARSPANPNQD